ncbi:Lrp/AsnC family transcriptional regulator [Sciscionella marina]|uniref:Lrp/AsnC family transcriptional regulator n=1 Tax=Sciscionella marina TaxID=508770 RepID=UPI00035D6BF1|nr:Lrp/AsnC family transcriptional regulator [Sciscionella marina]
MSSEEPIEARVAGRMAPALDEIDEHILRELSQDGRLSVRVLAERITISRAAAYNRIERLKKTGVLTGFTATVDPARCGLSTSAYVTLTVRQNNWRDLTEHLRRLPEVKHMALVGGEFDVVLLVRTTSNEHLRHLVLDKLQEIPGVLGTTTLLIFDDLANA